MNIVTFESDFSAIGVLLQLRFELLFFDFGARDAVNSLLENAVQLEIGEDLDHEFWRVLAVFAQALQRNSKQF